MIRYQAGGTGITTVTVCTGIMIRIGMTMSMKPPCQSILMLWIFKSSLVHQQTLSRLAMRHVTMRVTAPATAPVILLAILPATLLAILPVSVEEVIDAG